MTPYPILNDLAVVMLGAAAMVLAGRVARVPPILAYMVGGLLLGPVTGILAVSESLHLFAELGVALLLFVVGLEMSVAKLRDFGGTAVVAGTGQVILSFLIGAGLAALLGFETGAIVVTGLVVAFSSTAVVIKLLDRTGAMEASHGRIAVGILLVQDVLVVIVLTLLGGWTSDGSGGGLGEQLAGLGLSVLGMLGLIAGGAALARWVLPGLFDWMRSRPEGVFVLGLTWAFAFMIGAETLHLSVELGAFVAGVILAQLPWNEELHRRTHPLVDFFLAVFFVTLGAGIETSAMASTWPAAIAVSLLVLTAKPVIVAGMVRLAGRDLRTGVLAGLTLGQISEFAFILAALAAGVGLVDSDYLGFVGLVGILTIGASAVVVPMAPRIADAICGRRLPHWLQGPQVEPGPGHDRRGHVIVVGMNTLGRLLVQRFHDTGAQVLAVDTDITKMNGLPVEKLVGDMTLRPVFDEADTERAALVVSAVQIEDVNSLLTFRCERAGVPISVHAFDPTLSEELLECGADHLMISKIDGIRSVERGLRELGVFG